MTSAADPLNRKGAELQLIGDEEGARLHYIAALSVDPVFVPAMANLAQVLSNRNLLQPAAILLKRILRRVPHDGIQWNNYGNILTRLERYDEADQAFCEARERCPDNVGVWHNSMLLAHRLGQQEQALEYLDRVIALGGDSHQIQNDRAHIFLAQGDLTNGLEAYESRWCNNLQHLEPWDFHIPEWKGEDLRGKSILFHAEQGFGDSIMTVRFAHDLAALGAKVTVGAHPGLCRLFEHQSLDVLDISKMTESDARRFDYHSPMYSAMRWLGVTRESISGAPYLRPPEIVVPPVFRGDAFNVGICWSSGKRGTENDWRRRVSPLDIWLRFAEIPSVHLWSLFPGPEAQEQIAALGAEAIVQDRTSSFEDFADTAAFVAQLDLVISVDTAIAHLAAAMGKQTWMLSQFTPCWRWWDLANGSGRPWYDCMSVVPQTKRGDWAGQIDVCHSTLSSMARIRRKDAA